MLAFAAFAALAALAALALPALVLALGKPALLPAAPELGGVTCREDDVDGGGFCWTEAVVSIATWVLKIVVV